MYKKLVSLLIAILIFVLIFALGIVFRNYILLKNNKEKINKAQMVKINTKQNIKNMYMMVEKFADECRKINQLIVLEGDRTVRCQISNKDFEVSGFGKTPLGFLEKWYRDLNTKTIDIIATFTYEFVCDMDNLNIEVDNGKIQVKLNNTNIRLKSVMEKRDQTLIATNIGLLCNNFSPQETTAIMERVWVDCHNSIINDSKLYELALENAKENLKKLADKLGVEVNFVGESVYPLINENAEIIDDNIKK